MKFLLILCGVALAGCGTPSSQGYNTSFVAQGRTPAISCIAVSTNVGSFPDPRANAAASNLRLALDTSRTTLVFKENGQRFCGFVVRGKVPAEASHTLEIASKKVLVRTGGYRNSATLMLDLRLIDNASALAIWSGDGQVTFGDATIPQIFSPKPKDELLLYVEHVYGYSFELLQEAGFLQLPAK
jgi:hypothetical protein